MINQFKNLLLKHKSLIIQFIKFGLVWLSGVLLHLSITYTFTEYFWMYYLLSYYIGQFLWMTNNFVWNKYITFWKKDWKHIKQYMLSIVFYGITSLTSGWIVYLLTEYLSIWYIVSTIITIPFASLINFILHKKIVFKH